MTDLSALTQHIGTPAATDRLYAADMSESGSLKAVYAELQDLLTYFQAYDADTAKTDTVQAWTAQQGFTPYSVTSSSNAIAWDLDNQIVKHTLTENTTVSNPSNIVAGTVYTFIATQAAAASYSLSWAANYVFPSATPTVKQTYSAITVYNFLANPAGTQLLFMGGPIVPQAVISDATSWTPSLDHANSIIVLSNSSPITATIPANSSIPYPIGTTLTFMSSKVTGSSTITIAITTDTLIYDSTNLTLVINAGGAASATKITSTSWMVYGNLVAA